MDSKAQSYEENDVERGSEDLLLSSANYVRIGDVCIRPTVAGSCVKRIKKLCEKTVALVLGLTDVTKVIEMRYPWIYLIDTDQNQVIASSIIGADL